MRTPVRLLSAVLSAATLTLVAPLSASAAVADDPQLSLLEPTGEHIIGATSMALRDESRDDPWVPEDKRELMTTIWYPATESGAEPEQYLTPKESELFVAFLNEHTDKPVEPADVLSRVHTHATVDAPAEPGAHPLVVLSPGYHWPRATQTGLAEELASRGYLVVAIGHNHEATGIEFPDGHVTEFAATDNPEEVPPVRSADVRFVLDQLTADEKFGPLIDAEHVGMVGHSIGGASATETMVDDPRVDAGVNLDGSFFSPLPEAGLDRPFLLLGQGAHAPEGMDRTWDETWANLHGPKLWLTMNGSEHGTATDVSMLANQLGINLPGEPLPGARGAELANRYVAAFLDEHLRGQDQPLLDGPSEDNPEMLFWHQN